MLLVSTCLWDANARSNRNSRMYDESWVVRLHNGVARNVSKPFVFACFTDRRRDLPAPIVQILLSDAVPHYGAMVEPFRLGMPMILMGLDTIVTGNINHLADYCLSANVMALPADPYHPGQVCNGVALVPTGHARVYDEWQGENDMAWLRRFPHKTLDLIYPGQVVSYKGQVAGYGLGDARIVFFHGHPKPHELLDQPWIRTHWLGE